MATLAGVSANISRQSIQPVYAKYPNAGYLLACSVTPDRGPWQGFARPYNDGTVAAKAAIARRQPRVRGDDARSWWLRLAVDRGG
jgi:hypothetical protein